MAQTNTSDIYRILRLHKKKHLTRGICQYSLSNSEREMKLYMALRSAVVNMSNISSLSRFQGCLVGSVVGDCLGSPFECVNIISKDELNDFFRSSLDHKRKIDQHIKYTDDTAMARSVASSLIAKRTVDTRDMAQRFVEEYYRSPGRGYGGTVVNVFADLKQDDCCDPFGPASKSFDGQGSGGNGAAMRIAPLALFGYKEDQEKIIQMAVDISKITHSHLDGVNGAVLQCLAVHQALRVQSSETVNVNEYIDNLYKVIDKLDGEAPRRPKSKLDDKAKPFCVKLKAVVEYLAQDFVKTSTLVDNLGNNVLSLGSVPAAIYSFLRGFSHHPDFRTDNPFERSVMLAISLGGDTDTIATMAGGMAGAYWGVEKIPDTWQAVCEPDGIQQALKQANQLHSFIE